MTTPANQPDLLAFVRARYDDRERIARVTADHRQRPGELRWTQCDPEREPGLIGDGCGGVVTYDEGNPNEWQAAHIAENDPAWVLADLDSKRRILDEYDKALDRRKRHPDDLASAGALLAMVHVVKLLALPFAGHPDYREEWRP